MVEEIAMLSLSMPKLLHLGALFALCIGGESSTCSVNYLITTPEHLDGIVDCTKIDGFLVRTLLPKPWQPIVQSTLRPSGTGSIAVTRAMSASLVAVAEARAKSTLCIHEAG